MTDFNAEVSYRFTVQKKMILLLLPKRGRYKEIRNLKSWEDPLMANDNEYRIFGRKNELGTITILGGPQGRFSYTNGQINNLFVSVPELRNSSNNIVNFLEQVSIL